MRYIKRIIPMKTQYKTALFIRFEDVISAVFVNNILVAIMQGTLVGMGFWGFGIPSPIFWGAIAAFFALIPIIGPPIVWVPGVIYLFLMGNYYPALGLIIFGLIIGISDNIVRPILLKKKIEVHPFLILLSILGGLEVFGFLGIFMGPIIISLLVSVMHLYKLDFK